jgi:hypothetical protein
MTGIYLTMRDSPMGLKSYEEAPEQLSYAERTVDRVALIVCHLSGGGRDEFLETRIAAQGIEYRIKLK